MRDSDLCTRQYSLRSGYSRIPVHEPGKTKSFIGLLLVKRVSLFCHRSAILFTMFTALVIRSRTMLASVKILIVNPPRSRPFNKLFPSFGLFPDWSCTLAATEQNSGDCRWRYRYRDPRRYASFTGRWNCCSLKSRYHRRDYLRRDRR